MFRNFNKNEYYEEVKNIDWSTVLDKEEPELALRAFNDLFGPLIDRHAPVKNKL